MYRYHLNSAKSKRSGKIPDPPECSLHTEDSYSSSGRGLLWLPERKLTTKDRTWIEGALNKQGCVSIECALDKYQDFAMEFYSDGNGNIRYEGLSVFGAEKKGAYSECIGRTDISGKLLC